MRRIVGGIHARVTADVSDGVRGMDEFGRKVEQVPRRFAVAREGVEREARRMGEAQRKVFEEGAHRTTASSRASYADTVAADRVRERARLVRESLHAEAEAERKGRSLPSLSGPSGVESFEASVEGVLAEIKEWEARFASPQKNLAGEVVQGSEEAAALAHARFYCHELLSMAVRRKSGYWGGYGKGGK